MYMIVHLIEMLCTLVAMWAALTIFYSALRLRVPAYVMR